MRLIRVPLTIGAYASGVAELKFSAPEHANLAVIGLSVDKFAALRDHEVRAVKHGGRNGVLVHSVSGTNYYPPLGHVANYFNPDLAAGQTAITVTGALTDNLTGDAANGTIADITDPADAPASADALRDDLVANALAEIRAMGKELAAKSNSLRTNVASLVTNQEALALALQWFMGTKFQPWPGRLNDPADWQMLAYKVADKRPLTAHEAWRSRFARAVPCERFTAWPVTPGVDFVVEVARIFGSTSITRAYLWCIEFDSNDDTRLQRCQMPDYTDYPQWLTVAGQVSAGAAVQADVERQWVSSDLAPHALRITHLLAMAHSNNSGTFAYDVSYLQNLLLRVKEAGSKRLLPDFADVRQRLDEMAVQYLQQLDCWKRFDYLLGWNSSLLLEYENTAATSYQRDVRATFYGLLRPQSNGQVLDAR